MQALSLTKVTLQNGPITAMSSEHASRLKQARALKDLTQTQLAKAAGIAQGTIGNIESGIRGFGASIVKLATVLEVNAQWLATGEGEMRIRPRLAEPVKYLTYTPGKAHQSNAPLMFAGSVSASKVKVAGMARLGADGFFEELSGANPAASGTVDALSDDPAAYALCVSGDAGFPAIRDGEYIVVEPTLTPGPTDRVVIALKDGRTMLQELIVSKPESITVVCLDGTNRRTILRTEIREEFGIQVVTNIVSARKWSKAAA